MKTLATQEEQNKAALRRLLEETDKKNYAAWDEICAPDYQCHFPSNAKPISLEEHKQANKSLYAAFPDFRHTIEDIFAKGDMAVFRATLRGTHKGHFMETPPIGNSIEYSGIGMARFRRRSIKSIQNLLFEIANVLFENRLSGHKEEKLIIQKQIILTSKMLFSQSL